MLRISLAISSLALVLGLVGCQKEATKSPEPSTQAATTSSGDGAKPAGEAKLKVTDVKEGSGPAAKPGDLIIMEYTGKLDDGKVFDSNTAADKDPYSFVLGAGMVIKGWDEGVVGMKKGGIRKLDVPPAMAYGGQPMGDIPPNSTLHFEVKMLEHVPKGEEMIFDKTDVKVGSGAVCKAAIPAENGKPAVKGSMVTLHYVGTLANGKVFESTREAKKPVTYELGTGAIPGFDAAVEGMRVGGIRKMRIPPDIGFGQGGKPPKIPPGSVLFYEVELLKVSSS